MRAALLIPAVLLTGCVTTQGPSFISGKTSTVDADVIAGELVHLLSNTELQPAKVPVSLAKVKGDSFGEALHEQLAWAGYHVRLHESADAVALSYRAEVARGEGTFCVVANDGEGSLCREYRVPGARPISAVSAYNLNLNAYPSGYNYRFRNGAPIDDANFRVTDVESILFPNEKSQLTASAKAAARQVADAFASGNFAKLKIVGVSKGRSRVGNRKLAEARAHAIYDALLDAGVPFNRLQIDIDYSVYAQSGDLARGTRILFYQGQGAWAS